jgi:hypothetical protein
MDGFEVVDANKLSKGGRFPGISLRGHEGGKMAGSTGSSTINHRQGGKES